MEHYPLLHGKLLDVPLYLHYTIIMFIDWASRKKSPFCGLLDDKIA